jgi:hypothetical protein
MNALNVGRLLLRSILATLSGARRKVNCSLNTTVASIVMIIKIVIVTVVMTITVIKVL